MLFNVLNCVAERYSRVAQALPTHGSSSLIPKPANFETFNADFNFMAELSILKLSGDVGSKLYDCKNSGIFFTFEG